MKKILSVILILFISSFPAQTQAANKAYNAQIKVAINKYKLHNYVGCIQDLKYVINRDSSNTIAYYYLGNAYMQIGNKKEAANAFDKVINLNTAPPLTSYSIQAKNCMDYLGKCEYRKLSPEQIPELMKDPQNYITKLKEQEVATAGMEIDKEKTEIDKLIRGNYPNNIHPDARKVIIDTMLMKQQQDINSTADPGKKSEVPTNEEIAQAVKVLAKAGFNPYQANAYPAVPAYTATPAYAPNNEYASLSMLMGNNQGSNNNNYMNMLPFIMNQSQTGNKQISADMIQTMMMSSMMPDFNFDTEKKY